MRSQGRKCVGPPEDGRGQGPWELDTDEPQSEHSSSGCAGDELQQNHTLGIPTQLPTLTVVSRGCTTIGVNPGAKSVGLDQKGLYTPLKAPILRPWPHLNAHRVKCASLSSQSIRAPSVPWSSR